MERIKMKFQASSDFIINQRRAIVKGLNGGGRPGFFPKISFFEFQSVKST